MTKATNPPSASNAGGPASLGSAASTLSGPAVPIEPPPRSGQAAADLLAQLAAKRASEEAFARAMPENPLKQAEYDPEAARRPIAGTPLEADGPAATGSTLSEDVASAKAGSGKPVPGHNPANASLDRVRTDASGQSLTTNQGVRVGDNQNSLKAGLRGPSLLEDFILREKITHFDHERIPERVVHARGSGAHGYFESYEDLSALTLASPFAGAGKRTPVFVRFSTVAGERGSADTVRDVRGFAVKFYTDTGNWDLVGNNMPIFFIQDAMKFPDLVHAVKPEPHHAIPQASSAHDTFWDFVSLMPESTHMLMWIMSDRAIPRSYRMMQGFGVHTFRLVNAEGDSVFCKFHWSPRAGTHSLVWDEAVKIAGADPDFHRRDLWEAIEAGAFPEYELAIQTFTEEQAESWSFDILDPTKLVPEELVPLRPVGRMVLNRNPDNFFAETEQVAFCVAHVVPGIDFTNDPLLQGRIHSYVDTQISRLGGANFHEIPINSPVAQVHNNQRDGMHRQAINRGRVAYEPNSLGGGCPFQAGTLGFVPFPEPVDGNKLRGKPERFADHYTQARLFWESQSSYEQRHIVSAYCFELTRVQTPAIRARVVSLLANVDSELARQVAEGLGMEMPPAQQPVLPPEAAPEVRSSPALSLFARPGDGSVRARKVALLVGPDVEGEAVRTAYCSLLAAGAVPRLVGAKLGAVRLSDATEVQVEVTLETAPSALWDGLVLPAGYVPQPGRQLQDFIADQYHHCKPILAFGDAAELLWAADIEPDTADGAGDPMLILLPDASDSDADEDHALASERLAHAVSVFIDALGKPRNLAREAGAA